MAEEVPESTSTLQGESNEAAPAAAVATNGVVNGDEEISQGNEQTEPLIDELEEEVVLVNQEVEGDGSKDDEEVGQDESEE